MSIKRFFSKFAWILNEYIARFFVLVLNRRISVSELDNDFSKNRVLVISPHSDDESIGCFGIISQLNISPYYWLLCGKNENRVNEWRTAVSQMSSYDDLKMIVSFEQDGMLFKSSDTIYIDLVNYLKKYQIDQVFCPSFYDDHSDHRVISMQVLKALAEGHLKESFFYQTNYPIVYDDNLYKFEIIDNIRKKKNRVFKIFKSQNSQFDFATLARYQSYASWLAGSKYCEFFYKIDSVVAKQVIGKLLQNHTHSNYKKTSVLNVKNSLINILRTLQ